MVTEETLHPFDLDVMKAFAGEHAAGGFVFCHLVGGGYFVGCENIYHIIDGDISAVGDCPEAHRGVPLYFPQCVFGLVGCYGEQPWSQRSAGVEAVAAGEQLQECFLEDVLYEVLAVQESS